MDKFDRIIGYDAIKKDLRRYCDVFRNLGKYKSLGIDTPRGILLYGEPGVGKSFMAKCFIEESGLKSFTVRKEKPDGEFINYLKDTFNQAKEAAPTIVLLDDMDKYANEDNLHKDAEEYVTIQACIDDCKGRDVFVIATVNDRWCLPDSLVRVGRFDKVIEVTKPVGEDAIRILSHYVEQKKNVRGVDTEEIARILQKESCAGLENVINEAGIIAAYEGKEFIEQEDIIKAAMRRLFAGYNQEDMDTENDAIKRVAIHECGHAVMSELIYPESVSFIGIGSNCLKEISGVTLCSKNQNATVFRKDMENSIMIAVSGRAATEVLTGEMDLGVAEDNYEAFENARFLVEECLKDGFDSYSSKRADSDSFIKSNEIRVAALISDLYERAKILLTKNRVFLEMMTDKLTTKGYLTYKDIDELKAQA